MRILDMFKSLKPKPKQLELDNNSTKWPEALTMHLGIATEYQNFQENIESQKKQILENIKPYTNENTLSAVPDRARTMCALHGQEFFVQTKKLLTATNFTNIFSFEKEQDSFLESNSKYKGLVAKNTSALNEFFHDELKITQDGLQELEDSIIKFTSVLEQLQFPKVRKAKDLQLKIEQLTARSDKYSQLLNSLKHDLTRTQEKRSKIEDDMRTQQALVRNTEALTALQKAEKIEQELHDIVAKYVSVCDDLRNIFKNNPKLKIMPNVKHAIDELPKEPFQFLATEHEGVKDAFSDAIAILEEEKPGNVKNLINRLSGLVRDCEMHGRKIATMLPDQRALKRDIIKDIAALQVYDKQQFLMRAKLEEDALQTKIQFLTSELDPSKLQAMKNELKAVVKELGAVVKSEKSAEKKDPENTKAKASDSEKTKEHSLESKK